MGKMKEQCITIVEMLGDGKTPEQVATIMGMSVDEVIAIMKLMNYVDDSEFYTLYKQNENL